MLYHFIAIEFSDTATEEQRTAAWQALRSLPSRIPEIVSLRGGPDLGLATGNFGLAFVAEFADEAGWRAYQSSPAHLEVIERYLKPVIATRVAVQAVDGP